MQELPELVLEKILSHLTRVDQRTCLFVSKALYRGSLRFLFRTIKVFLGDWEYETPFAHKRHTSLTDLSKTRSTDANESWDLLRHVRKHPQFARVVRKIIVHAYSRVDYPDGEDAVDQCDLAKVLKKLPGLRSFHWVSSSPNLSDRIAKVLVASCPDLEELRASTLECFASKRLLKLKHLRSISLTHLPPLDDWASSLYLNSEPSPELTRLFHPRQKYLTSLELPAADFLVIPQDILKGLYHLKIWRFNKDEDKAFDKLLGAEEIKSLDLIGGREISFPQLLNGSDLVFAHLTSLRLSFSHPELHEIYFSHIGAFVLAHPLLRRLDLDIFAPGPAWRAIGPAFNKLAHLEVLGFVVNNKSGEGEANEEAVDLFPSLPQKLTSLNLVRYLRAEELRFLVEQIRKLSKLEFVRISFRVHGLPGGTLTGETFRDCLPSLAVLGINNDFWSVNSRMGKRTYEKWSLRKVTCRSAEDFGYGFGNEDAVWLLKSHIWGH